MNMKEQNMKQRILVVEDDNSVGNLLKDLLETNNYDVDWAQDGEEGLEKYYSQEYDLMILDVNIPKLSGLEVCKKIRQQPFGFITPIIILSVMDTLSDKFKGLCLGADEYLTKPFYVEGITKRIPIVMDYKKEKLLSNSLTKLPSFVKCNEKFKELAGTAYHLVYSDLTDYFKNIETFTQELLDTISKLSEIFKSYIEEDK